MELSASGEIAAQEMFLLRRRAGQRPVASGNRPLSWRALPHAALVDSTLANAWLAGGGEPPGIAPSLGGCSRALRLRTKSLPSGGWSHSAWAKTSLGFPAPRSGPTIPSSSIRSMRRAARP